MNELDYESKKPKLHESPYARLLDKIGQPAFVGFSCNAIGIISTIVVCTINRWFGNAPFSGVWLAQLVLLVVGTWVIGAFGVFASLGGIFGKKARWALIAILIGVIVIVFGTKLQRLTVRGGGHEVPGGL